jgi:hypothetical protein
MGGSGNSSTVESEQERLREMLRACDTTLARLRAHGQPESLTLARHIERTREDTVKRLAAVRPHFAHRARTF